MEISSFYEEYLILRARIEMGATLTSVQKKTAAAGESRTLLQRNFWRAGLLVVNDGSNDVLLRYGDDPASSDSWSLRIAPDVTYELTGYFDTPKDAIQFISVSGTPAVYVTEWSIDTNGLPTSRAFQRFIPTSGV